MSADAPIPFAGFVAGSDQFSDAVAFSGGGDIRLVLGTKTKAEPIFTRMITRAGSFPCVVKLSFPLQV
jgi:hypothetical protein